MAIKLTADQAEQLAHGLLDCADALDRRLVSDWRKLDDPTKQQLMDLAQQMRAKSALLVNTAVGMILDEAKEAFGQIISATKAGEAAIVNIQTVGQIVTIAASLVALGAAVASKDPVASVKAATDLFDEIA